MPSNAGDDPERPPSVHPAAPGWTAAPAPAEQTLRQVQGLLVERGRDPTAVLGEIRAALAAAGYPTEVLGGLDPDLAASLFGGG